MGSWNHVYPISIPQFTPCYDPSCVTSSQCPGSDDHPKMKTSSRFWFWSMFMLDEYTTYINVYNIYIQRVEIDIGSNSLDFVELLIW